MKTPLQKKYAKMKLKRNLRVITEIVIFGAILYASYIGLFI
jgi:hypothetical protein